MNEGGATGGGPDPVEAPVTAGGLLKAARQAQNVHIGVLAANLKVPQARLEALEADRLGDMPDATFVRALAQSVCRVLKIDAAPILALLPAAGAHALARVDAGLNMPFRERPGRSDPTPTRPWRHPVFWLVVVLLAGAAALALWRGPLPWQRAGSANGMPAPPGRAGLAVAPSGEAAGMSDGRSAGPAALSAETAVPAATPVLSLQAPAPMASGPAPVQGQGLPVAVLSASSKTWVQVIDAEGAVVLSRELAAGESVSAQGRLPMRLVIGNAQGTQLSFGGRPVDLSAATRDNVARLELNLP